MSATDRSLDEQFQDLDQVILDEAKPEPQLVEDEKLDLIDGLLSGKSNENNQDDETENNERTSDSDEHDETDQDEGEEEQENAELEAIDYDQKIEVPMPYGMEKKTIGQLKDEVSQMHIKEKNVQKRENEIMSDQRYLSALVNSLGQLPPETMAILDAQKQQTLVRETKAMNQAIPEWEDKQAYIRDDKQMLGLASNYGFTESEYRGVIDHRLIKIVRDFALLRARVEGAKVNAIKNPGRKQSRRKVQQKRGVNQEQMIKAAQQSNNPAIKDAAIAKLLGVK